MRTKLVSNRCQTCLVTGQITNYYLAQIIE